MSVPKSVLNTIEKYMSCGKVWWRKPIIIRLFGKKLFHWYGVPLSREIDVNEFFPEVTKNGKYGHNTWAEFRRKRMIVCPLQYWFRQKFIHGIDLWFSVKHHQLSDLKYSIKCFFKPNNIIKIEAQKYNEYRDTDYKIEHSAFQLFKNYIELENPFEHFDYDYIPFEKASEEKRMGHNKKQYEKYWIERLDFKKKCEQCLKWYTVDRFKLEKKIDKALTKATNKRKVIKDVALRYAEHDKLEKELEETTTQWLVWIVQNRTKFWT